MAGLIILGSQESFIVRLLIIFSENIWEINIEGIYFVIDFLSVFSTGPLIRLIFDILIILGPLCYCFLDRLLKTLNHGTQNLQKHFL